MLKQLLLLLKEIEKNIMINMIENYILFSDNQVIFNYRKRTDLNFDRKYFKIFHLHNFMDIYYIQYWNY